MQNRRTPLVVLVALAGLASMLFGAGRLIAHAAPLQASGESSAAASRFSGTWHWMFNGKSFATLTLTRNESGYSGSLSGVHIELNDDGSLRVAEPTENPSPSPIKKASLEGSDLHITIMDGDDPMEWVMTLKDDTHGEIRWAGTEGPKMKPIRVEKAR